MWFMNSLLVLVTMSVFASNLCGQELTSYQKDSIIQEGIKYHDRGEYKEALKMYNAVLEVDSLHCKALYESAFSAFRMADNEQSLVYAQRAMRSCSERRHHELYQLMGNSYDDLGQREESIKMYRAALASGPDNYLVHYNMAVTFFRMGKEDSSLAHGERGAMLKPKHPGSLFVIASLYSAQDRTVPSILALLRFLTLEPTGNRAEVSRRLLESLVRRDFTRGTSTDGRVKIDVTSKLSSAQDSIYNGIALLFPAFVASELESVKTDAPIPFTTWQKILPMFTDLLGLITADPSLIPPIQAAHREYFLQLGEAGHSDAFVHYIFSGSNNDEISAWMTINAKAVANFKDWNANYAPKR